MVRISLSEEQKQLLLTADGVVELCDASGNLLARALPNSEGAPDGRRLLTPELSEEEYQRRLHSTEPGISGDELLARLQSRL